jgi:hypothetical protein
MNNERESLLSDKAVANIAESLRRTKDLTNIAALHLAQGIVICRDHYERLIDEGNLRVVEEVELDDDGCCPKCGAFLWMPDAADGSTLMGKYCPECGNKIKR